jgi:hypothetical protein
MTVAARQVHRHIAAEKVFAELQDEEAYEVRPHRFKRQQTVF